MKDVATVLKKWQDNTAGATKAYVDGVNRVSVSPTAQAAQALEKARQNYNAAIDSGRMANALNNVSLASWKASASGKGAANLQNGVRAATPKMQAFLTAFLPVAEQASQEAKSIPNVGPNDWINRVVAVVNRFKQFAGKM